MLHRLERSLDELVVIVVWESGFNFEIDGPACARHVKTELDAASEPVFVLIDMHLHDVDLDILLATANMAVDGDLLRAHSNLKQMLLISPGNIKQVTVTPRDDQPSVLPPVRIFSTREDALMYVRTSVL